MKTSFKTIVLVGLAALLFGGAPQVSMAPESPLPAVGTRNPETLDEVIIAESFDSTPNGELPAGWQQVSVDSGVNQDILYGGPTIWQAIQRVGITTHTGPGVCINVYNTIGANNDWLILPRMDTLVAPISLSYWVSSQDASNLENFDVRVSTTNAQPASFTNVIRSVVGTPRTWHQYTEDLSAYAGAPFYVAIHYTSLDRYMIKVDDVRLNATRLSAASPKVDQPREFAFEGNYPNPFNGRTEFHFTLNATHHADLVLYDILGQEVAHPLSGTLEAGAHAVSFDAAGLPSGVYFARLSAAGISSTRKVMLLK